MSDLSPIFDAAFHWLGRLLGTPAAEVELDFWPILVGLVCTTSLAILGCFLVLRRMSLLGDAISHSILPGLALAFLLTATADAWPMFVGALAFGLLAAFLTQTLSRYGQVPEDSSLGVVFTSLFALGVVLLSQVEQAHIDADCVLFGVFELVALDTRLFLGVEVPRVLASLGAVLGLTLLFTVAFWKELKISSFDPALATAMGINATLMHYLLMGMVAAATVASLEAVGAILVVAMLIVPGATAHLLTDRLRTMIVWAVVVGWVSSILGYLAAVQWNTNAAGMMAVVAGLQFSAAVLFARRHGVLSRAAARARLALRIATEDILAVLYRREEKRSAALMPANAASRLSESDSTAQPTSVAVAWSECARFGGGGAIGWLAVLLLRLGGELAADSAGKCRLTEHGREKARLLVRAHRLWESWLDTHFDLPADHLHAPAERIEHFLGPDLQERLEQEVAGRVHDPHGSVIPPAPEPAKKVGI